MLLSLDYFEISCLPPLSSNEKRGANYTEDLIGAWCLALWMAFCFPSPSPAQRLCSAHLWPHHFQSSQDLFSERLSVFLPNLWSDTPPPSHRVHIQYLDNVTLRCQLVYHKGLPIVYMFERMRNSQFSKMLVAENQPPWEYIHHGTWKMQSSSCPHVFWHSWCVLQIKENFVSEANHRYARSAVFLKDWLTSIESKLFYLLKQ